jgi:hypothetical protein
MKKSTYIISLLLILLLAFTACGKEEQGKTEEAAVDINGTVDSPDDFIKLGLYLDIDSSNITEKTYSISQDEIAEIDFVYNGLKCELKGSSKYSKYELAGVSDTSTDSVISTSIGGCNAVYFTLQPGRVVFWDDGTIFYSLYTYVTAEDSVINDIIDHVVFENHYNERADVEAATADASYEFAAKVVDIIQAKDLEALSEIIKYPQMISNGLSVGNVDELMSIDPDELFTDMLQGAVNKEALDDLRLSEDETEYIIGTNYKNVHFSQDENGDFKIVKINN